MTEPLRVLLYARQSEERPGEDARTSLSLRSQEDRGRQWAADNNAVVLGVVTDHDLRGHDPARPGIRQLLDDAERLRADAVWVLSLSRFARDHILQELVWRDLQARGVTRLISDIESGTDDPFIRGIYGLLHAKSKVEMSAHLRGAFARRARDGGFPTGPTPTGYVRPYRITVTRANGTSYERQTGEPVIEPEGAAFIRQLFDRFDQGESLHAITDDLARAGPGVRGGNWVPRTVKRMLQSPIYVGDILSGGHVVAHNDAWQIVDRAVWDRVQARFTRREPVVKRGTEHWLEGLVEHACGRRMYFQPDRRGKAATAGLEPALPSSKPGDLPLIDMAVEGLPVSCIRRPPIRAIGKAGTAPISGTEQSIPGTYGCRTSWEPLRCAVPRRMIGATLLDTAVRDCLHADLDHLLTPVEAATMAQERFGGNEWRRRRARIETAHTDAHTRWKRNHERFSAGKLPPDVMDAEDARLAEAETTYRDALAALPAPPDPDAIAREYAALTAYRDVLDVMTPDELRTLVTLLGTVIVGPSGVALNYRPAIAELIPAPCVRVVPRNGKGMR